jgi:oligopeptide/dipeptide ABC transporter ATP-binding protein
MTLLQVSNLKAYFHTMAGTVKAVDGVSFDVNESEVVGLVGESGCGKSASQLALTQLISVPPGEIVDGEAIFEGQDILKLKPNSKELRLLRGGKIAMVFQEPMTSLNPVLTIGSQIIETMELHLGIDRATGTEQVGKLLEEVGIPDARVRMNNYPHQFSGGMRQRVMIAIALACHPKLVIADEPTTALDVTTQSQILEIMMEMIRNYRSSLILVTHNLGIVARYANRINVMYAGKIVEAGTAKEIFHDPRHPYTIGLLKSVPRLDRPREKELVPIWGVPPNLIDMPLTCAFLPRCSYGKGCRAKPAPELMQISASHFVRCNVDIRGRIT